MSKTIEMPGQQALISPDDLPEGSVIKVPQPVGCMNYAEWCLLAEPYLIRRASEPGWFTYYDAVAEAPKEVRDPANQNWPGLFTGALHRRHVLEAVFHRGVRVYDDSHKPESGGSAVKVWEGVEAKRKAARAVAA